jgi:hypothetical protein
MESYWKCTTGFDCGPVLKGNPCYWALCSEWELAVKNITPIKLEQSVQYNEDLTNQGLLKPCFIDHAAMDFSGDEGPGLWPMEPLTDEELKVVLLDPDYNVFDLNA